jgi:hypothetical protein
MDKHITAMATIALSLVLSFPMMSLLPPQSATAQQSQDKIDVPLNFSLKSKGDDGEQANASSMKDVTVTLKVKTSENGSATDIPLTAKVSNDTAVEDLELCGSLQGTEEMCHSLREMAQSAGENQSSNSSNQSGSDNSTNGKNENNDDEDN